MSMDLQKIIEGYRMHRDTMVDGAQFSSFRYAFTGKPRSDAAANQRIDNLPMKEKP